MSMMDRWVRVELELQFSKPFVHIVFGARQVGKTTLINDIIKDCALYYNLADPEERTRLLADPGAFRRECEALSERKKPCVVFVDEAQRVPDVFDAVQVLYDGNKSRWRFILCGSSSRKLRKAGTNLLPGRCMLHRMFPLVLAERPAAGHSKTVIEPLVELPGTDRLTSQFPPADIEERLAYGELPGIVLLDEADRGIILRSFTTAHLEEEVRKEALVEDWGAFVVFLRLAAAESGSMINYAAISQQVGLSQPTVKSYYQLLEDMFMGFRLPAFKRSPRKNLLSTPRFFFSDVGICQAAQGITPGRDVVLSNPGKYFEQWVIAELWKRLQYIGKGKLHYFCTKDGAEIDAVLETTDRIIPIEVKWTERPSRKDARHLLRFIEETPNATDGYIVCRCPRPQKIADNITAIPWQNL
ncbi:MAG: ATP-binding protein [Chloroflexi bacterium]|nr:ATP-binding protein [Chloroflexota bacterium]